MQARDKTTGEPLSDEVIGGLVSEFIRVGTDTTATTIAFAGQWPTQPPRAFKLESFTYLPRLDLRVIR
jgi:cytochrome P450